MNFLRTLVNSVCSPAFYRTIPGKSLRSAIGYFAILSTVAGLLMASLLVPILFKLFTPKTIDSAVNAYPADLSVQVTKGEVSMNQPSPYYVSNPDNKAPVKNFVVIDTEHEFTPALLEEYSTQVLVTKHSIGTKQENGEVRIIPTEKLGDVTLTRETVANWGKALYPYLVPAALAFFILAAIFVGIGKMFTLVFLFLIAVLVLALSALRGWHLSYGSSYKVALYAATGPLLLDTVLSLYGVHMPALAFGFLLLAVVVSNLGFQKGSDIPVTPTI